jgi:hypothetical protein
MSRFILYHFSDLVREGLKIYKGFKEVNLNQVSKDLSEFAHVEVASTQVNNHLTKWCAKWVKICRLRELCQVGEDLQAEGTKWCSME